MTGVVLLKPMAGSASGTQDKCVTGMQVDGRGAKSPPTHHELSIPWGGATCTLAGLSSKPKKSHSLMELSCCSFHGRLLSLSPSFQNLRSWLPSCTTHDEGRIFIFCYSTRERNPPASLPSLLPFSPAS